MQGTLSFLLALPLVTGLVLPREPADEVQENFDQDRFMGKWYSLGLASTCPWLIARKSKMSMSTLVLKPSNERGQVDATVTFTANGQCTEKTAVYRETETPGHMKYHVSRWDADVDIYVVRTNYDEYAMVLMLTQKEGKVTKTAKLYGRTQELRPSLLAEFKQFALEQGFGEDTFQILPKTEECQPSEIREEPVLLKVRRDVGQAQPPEGSGDDSPFFRNEDSCKLPQDQGPCFGYETRFFYNATLMTCQEFSYGGCLGNENNFVTEKECLQSCRTEAVCRLPIQSGSCTTSTELWAFDSTSGKCVPFKYSSCQGNGNRFYTQKECEEYCGTLRDGEEEFLGLLKKN
ncbi:protein AMBP [Huso huso]|uniref:Protein AMBP n=1 Tax=Huso huso TaxID=61971 RepID=A0ABR0YEH8_HUSHU